MWFLLEFRRGGTTSLTDLLVHQLQLFVISGPNSESQFFSYRYNDRDFNNYIDRFTNHRKEQGNLKSFDGSTTYFRFAKDVFQRMKALYTPESLQRKKFVLSLREPVSREFSWFAFMAKRKDRIRISTIPSTTLFVEFLLIPDLLTVSISSTSKISLRSYLEISYLSSILR